MKILVCGLSGAGKTTLARHLQIRLQAAGQTVEWYNADVVRAAHKDWDFSDAGRSRQAERMAALATDSDARYTLCDFIAPTRQIRELFGADYTVWLDTVKTSQFADTDRVFEPPTDWDMRVTHKDAVLWASIIAEFLEI